MEQILTLYEAARVRATFRLETYPKIAIYAAWLYYRKLPKAVSKLIEIPSDLKGDDNLNPYEEVAAKQKTWRQTGELEGPPLTVAAAVTTPPVLRISRFRRNQQEGADSGKRSQKGRRSSSTERSQSPDRRGPYRDRNCDRSMPNPRRRGRVLERGVFYATGDPSPCVPRVRCFFCNPERDAFTQCDGWKHWVQEDPKNRYLCFKCHRGRHNVGVTRRLRESNGKLLTTPRIL